ncbi:MAG: glycosyltransferase family 4 protein [Candidatus Omnitrophica bacterium]|nr:glycosyltransferase family 4 protein [Candidatus Omnitrophota bacterium]
MTNRRGGHVKVAVVGTRGFPDVPGGVEAHCENLYPRLARQGCAITVFTRRPYVPPKRFVYKNVALQPVFCPKQKFLEALVHTLCAVVLAGKLRPDIIHFHALGPSLFVPLARVLGMKVVMTTHGPEYKRKKWNGAAKAVLRLGEWAGVRFADAVIAISEPIAADIRNRRKEITVIPNGVAVPALAASEEILKKYGIQKNKYILAVGRFVPEKGFHDLIAAFAAHDFSDWKLVIAGDADHEDRYSSELKKQARRHPQVVLPGYLTGQPLSELYSHAGLFVLPSYYEGLPIALLEAMSYQRSCIVSDIPAHKNVVTEAERFFAPGDVAALAEKIAVFARRPLSEAEKLRQLEVLKRFDWDTIAENTLAVYKKVLGYDRKK